MKRKENIEGREAYIYLLKDASKRSPGKSDMFHQNTVL